MKETQGDAILSYLQDGGVLTPAEALRRFGCARLAARIWELRRSGYDIRSDLTPVETRSGGVARVSAYYLSRGAQGMYE